MKARNRSNVLVLEILIAVLFFMLASTVILRVFATSYNMTVRAGTETEALFEAENIVEAITAADDIDEELTARGFIGAHGMWTKNFGAYTISVQGSAAGTAVGELWQGTVSAIYTPKDLDEALGDNTLLSLPCVRYREVPQ